jgi:hypothetical protein
LRDAAKAGNEEAVGATLGLECTRQDTNAPVFRRELRRQLAEAEGIGLEIRMRGKEPVGDLLALLGLERANRVDEAAGGLQPMGGTVEHRPLRAGERATRLRPRPIQCLGVAAEDAGRRAGRVEQDRVSRRARRPEHQVGGGDLGDKPGAGEIFDKSSETTLRDVDRDRLEARRGELHRLAAGRRAEIEGETSRARAQQPRRDRGREILHPISAFGKAGELADGGAGGKAQMIRQKGDAVQLGGRYRARHEHEIERRRRREQPGGGAGGGDAPMVRPPGGDLGGQARHFGQNGGPTKKGSENAVDEAAGSPLDEGERSGYRGMGRRAERQYLDERDSKDVARLGIAGQSLSGRRIDQGVEIGQTPQRLRGDGMGEGAIVGAIEVAGRGIERGFERQPLAQDRAQQPEGGSAGRGASRFRRARRRRARSDGAQRRRRRGSSALAGGFADRLRGTAVRAGPGMTDAMRSSAAIRSAVSGWVEKRLRAPGTM